MKRYAIFAGLNGGFGRARFSHIDEFRNEDQAMGCAWEIACGEYDGMAGLHGLRSIDDIMSEEGIDEDDAWDIYAEEREGWLDYEAKELEDHETEKDFN